MYIADMALGDKVFSAVPRQPAFGAQLVLRELKMPQTLIRTAAVSRPPPSPGMVDLDL
jgi:hypothetical protein